jgi:hypothetical protein
MMGAGSSLHGILNAVLLQNMYFVRNWYIPLYVGGRGLSAASLSLAAAGAYCLGVTRLGPSRRLDLAVARPTDTSPCGLGSRLGRAP